MDRAAVSLSGLLAAALLLSINEPAPAPELARVQETARPFTVSWETPDGSVFMLTGCEWSTNLIQWHPCGEWPATNQVHYYTDTNPAPFKAYRSFVKWAE